MIMSWYTAEVCSRIAAVGQEELVVKQVLEMPSDVYAEVRATLHCESLRQLFMFSVTDRVPFWQCDLNELKQNF